jgi:hypothetical protein
MVYPSTYSRIRDCHVHPARSPACRAKPNPIAGLGHEMARPCAHCGYGRIGRAGTFDAEWQFGFTPPQSRVDRCGTDICCCHPHTQPARNRRRGDIIDDGAAFSPLIYHGPNLVIMKSKRSETSPNRRLGGSDLF